MEGIICSTAMCIAANHFERTTCFDLVAQSSCKTNVIEQKVLELAT